jgi:hypothetical protein
MPVKVYVDYDNHAEVAWLCDDIWHLSEQVDALAAWLQQNHSTLDRGRYIADIGFSPRPDAAGGGAAISPEILRTMGEVGMSLFLSEYPPFIESDDRAT